MIYQIFVKNSAAPPQHIHTHKMELARSILKERFFQSMNMDEAIEVSMDATETDQTKTGIIMSFRVKTKQTTIAGTVTAIKEEDFFTETWEPELLFPKSFNVNFI